MTIILRQRNHLLSGYEETKGDKRLVFAKHSGWVEINPKLWFSFKLEIEYDDRTT